MNHLTVILKQYKLIIYIFSYRQLHIFLKFWNYENREKLNKSLFYLSNIIHT